jgi:hypothetical protein
VGPVLAGVFFAEIGDVHRFPTAAHLVSWAGLTPRHRESDTTVHRGSITKQGSTLVRWAAVETVQKTPADAGCGALKTGQCHVQRYMEPLLRRIERGEIDPTRVITHRLPLQEAPHGYEIFKQKQDNCEKVVLKP